MSFRLLFMGGYNGYDDNVGRVDTEKRGYFDVEDSGKSVRAKAGCRDQWLSHASAAKLGISLLAAAGNHAPILAPHVVRLRSKDGKHVVYVDSGDITGSQHGVHIGSDVYSFQRWEMDTVENPATRILTSPLDAACAAMNSALVALTNYANTSDEVNDRMRTIIRTYFTPAEGR